MLYSYVSDNLFLLFQKVLFFLRKKKHKGSSMTKKLKVTFKLANMSLNETRLHRFYWEMMIFIFLQRGNEYFGCNQVNMQKQNPFSISIYNG